MNLTSCINKRIRKYHPKGGLDHTAQLFLSLYSISHPSTLEHVQRVALLGEAVAKDLKKDAKATFFAGILHDIGKIVLPCNLFDGHNVSGEEYAYIRTHAKNGFKILKKFHMFTALCAGLHHNLYKSGYGLSVGDFPSDWSPATVKKVLEISTIISICDFVDAYTHRKTEIKDGSGTGDTTLFDMLKNKYPDDIQVIKSAIKSSILGE